VNEIRVRHGQGVWKRGPSETSDANLRIFLLTIFGPCGRPKTPFQTCLPCSLRLNVIPGLPQIEILYKYDAEENIVYLIRAKLV
jgi:hypothetical protein